MNLARNFSFLFEFLVLPALLAIVLAIGMSAALDIRLFNGPQGQFDAPRIEINGAQTGLQSSNLRDASSRRL